jgi:hypothetical protein
LEKAEEGRSCSSNNNDSNAAGMDSVETVASEGSDTGNSWGVTTHQRRGALAMARWDKHGSRKLKIQAGSQLQDGGAT